MSSTRHDKIKSKRKKDPARIALGKKNRRSGRNFERTVYARLSAFGLPVYKTPLSGGLKSTGILPFLHDHLAGDLQMDIKEEKFIIECKHTSTHDKMFKDIDKYKCIHYQGFCHVMDDDTFQDLLFGHDVLGLVKEDKTNKWLHDFFEQDKCHIVVIGKNYMGNLYCVRDDVMDKIKGSSQYKYKKI